MLVAAVEARARRSKKAWIISGLLTAAVASGVVVPAAAPASAEGATFVVNSAATCDAFIVGIGGTGSSDSGNDTCKVYSGTLAADATATFEGDWTLRTQWGSNPPGTADFVNDGTLNLVTTALLYVAGTTINNGTINMADSSGIVVYRSISNAGTINIGAGSAFQLAGASMTNSGTVHNAGTLSLWQPIVNVCGEGVVTGSGTVESVTQAGIIQDDCPDFDFGGFLAPIDEAPAENLAKAGSAVPVKFSLHGYQGMDVVTVLTSSSATCTGGTTDPIEQTAAAGSGVLSYDPATDTYSLVWKTVKGWAGSCRQLELITSDGVTHTAEFRFR